MNPSNKTIKPVARRYGEWAVQAHMILTLSISNRMVVPDVRECVCYEVWTDLLLGPFPDFEKLKGCLWDHFAVSVYPPIPESRNSAVLYVYHPVVPRQRFIKQEYYASASMLSMS
jgi:hypothetical protein